MSPALDSAALDQLFFSARTFNTFTDEPVGDDLLASLYDLYKWGPTSMNCQPGRVVFVRSAEAKEKLKPALMPNNLDKAMGAPVVAIVAYDTAFFEHMSTQFPAVPGMSELFAGNAPLSEQTAFRNGTLQGAYLIIAARALGLAVGPMSGFDPAAVDAAFFPDGRWKSNFLVNLGWGDPAGNRPRGPRLSVDDAVRLA